MKFLLEEQEAVIWWDEVEKRWVLWTNQRGVMDKLRQKMGPVEERRDGEGVYAAAWHLPKKWVKVGPPRRVSEEQRAVMAERARARGFGKKAG